MSASRGHGWFWAGTNQYPADRQELNIIHRILASYDFALLTPDDQASLHNLLNLETLKVENILPIFRNRWRLDDRIGTFKKKFHPLETHQYLIDLNEPEKTKHIHDLEFAIFALRARIELDIQETQHKKFGLGYARQVALNNRCKMLDKYINMHASIMHASIMDEQRLNNLRVEQAPIGPYDLRQNLSGMISWINMGRLFWVWLRGDMSDIMSAVGLGNNPGMAALNTAAAPAGHMSYAIYALRILLKLADDTSLTISTPEMRKQIGFWERFAYYLDTSKDAYINDLIFWGPVNFVTCATLNIVGAATGGLMTLGLLGVDFGMSINTWLELKASYNAEKLALDTYGSGNQVAKETLRNLELEYKYAQRKALFSAFCFSLLVIALAIMCVALCYAGLPVAAFMALSLTCSVMCYSAGLLRETGNFAISVQHEQALRDKARDEADSEIVTHYHDEMIKYMTKNYSVNMLVLLSVSVASMLILSFVAWPAWGLILAIVGICLVLGALQYAFAQYNPKPEMFPELDTNRGLAP